MDVLVRPAVVTELLAVEVVRITTWKVAYQGLVPHDVLHGMAVTAAQVERLTQRFLSGELDVVVAVDEEDVIGFAACGASRDEDLPELRELWALYILEDYWDTGTGARLLAASGDVQVLWVLEANARGRAFYERHGFQPDGTRKVREGLGAEVRYVLG